MSIANHISQDDLLLFALQFLPEDQMTLIQKHLESCEDCRRQVAWIQGDLASFAMTAESHEVPAGSQERLMKRISKEKKQQEPIHMVRPVAEIATQEAARPQSNVVSFDDAPVRTRMGAAGWAGWAVAAMAIVAGGLEFQQNQGVKNELAETKTSLVELQSSSTQASTVLEALTDSSAKQVALHVSGQTVLPEAHASYLAKKGSMVFVANHLQQLQANMTYELWLLPAEKGAAPIPAGTFRPDSSGRASMVASTLPQNVDVAGFGVTIEPGGGSATPTMPIVLSGMSAGE
jgi:predicted anti-sigma-YlaC factor YlaD